MATTVAMNQKEFENSLKAQGGKIQTKWEGGNREPAVRLEKGDKFTIPADMRVYSQPITGSTRMYQFTRVEVENNGNKAMKNIGSSLFTRRLPLLNEDGTPTGIYAACTGTVHDEFIQHGTLNDAFQAIAGREMVVTDVTPGLTRSFNADQLTTTSYFYTIDFVKQYD